MSDLLTHWAVFEDCRRLAGHDEGVEPLFREMIEAEREWARLGAITRGGNRWMPAILARARDRWAREEERPDLRRKVAFALGGLTHQACDHVMKPLMSERAGADWDTTHYMMQHGQREGEKVAPVSIREVSAYYDTHVFRQVYLSGQEEPFNRFLLAANDSGPGRALEEFARALFQRALLSSHTLNPDRDDIDGWLDRLFARVQPLYIDIALYTDIFARPDPVKMERYGVETAFYHAGDPAIAAARALQRGEAVGAGRVRAALAAGANASGYGRALEIGLAYLRNGAAFWRGEVDTLSAPNYLRSAVSHHRLNADS